MKNFKEFIAEDAEENLISQLRKVISLRGNHVVTFHNGETLKVDTELAREFMKRFENTKSPRAKWAALKLASQNKDNFMAIAKGGMPKMIKTKVDPLALKSYK